MAECAVFGIPDAQFGELPAAYIALKAGATATTTRLDAGIAIMTRLDRRAFLAGSAAAPAGSRAWAQAHDHGGPSTDRAARAAPGRTGPPARASIRAPD